MDATSSVVAYGDGWAGCLSLGAGGTTSGLQDLQNKIIKNQMYS